MNDQKLPLSQKFGVLLGSGGFTGIFSLTTMLSMLFFTTVMGLSPAAVGTMILISKVWDAINDPSVGAAARSACARQGPFAGAACRTRFAGP